MARMGTGKQVIFCGGDGIVYGFAALDPKNPPRTRQSLKKLWQFDCDPNAPKVDVRSYQRNRKVSPTSISGMPVFYENRVYVTAGGDIWWGKNEAWLHCIDATARVVLSSR